MSLWASIFGEEHTAVCSGRYCMRVVCSACVTTTTASVATQTIFFRTYDSREFGRRHVLGTHTHTIRSNGQQIQLEHIIIHCLCQSRACVLHQPPVGQEYAIHATRPPLALRWDTCDGNFKRPIEAHSLHTTTKKNTPHSHWPNNGRFEGELSTMSIVNL